MVPKINLETSLLFSKKIRAKPGLFLLLGPLHNTKDKYSRKFDYKWKIEHGVYTWDANPVPQIVASDESTELWWPKENAFAAFISNNVVIYLKEGD